MAESFAKKERNKLKAKKKQEKAEKTKQRKESGTSSFEDMIVYVDEFGNFSNTPITTPKEEVKLEDIVLGAAPLEPISTERKGTVTHFDPTKGFGFIKEPHSDISVFVHQNELTTPIKTGDRVTFERGRNEKGYFAIAVKKV